MVRETSEKRGALFLRWEKPETGTGKSFLFMLGFFFLSGNISVNWVVTFSLAGLRISPMFKGFVCVFKMF